MKNDLSKQLYEKYFNLINPKITLTLKNGCQITGQFIAFCYGDKFGNDTYVWRWQILTQSDKNTLGLDPFGFLVGIYVLQKDISIILFHQDNSTIRF